MAMFDEDKSLFRDKINEITERDQCEKTISDLFKLNTLRKKNADSKKLVELYNLLGPELFADVISIIDGETIKFPTVEQFKDDINVCISYYLKYQKGESWETVRNMLGCDGSTVKYGINCSKLDAYIRDCALNAKDDD